LAYSYSVRKNFILYALIGVDCIHTSKDNGRGDGVLYLEG